ncbi:formyltransferase family protein [Niveispirillum fermenti]|uniref:formyltransferase family protein n=1 Tax=Niveispirillum fermenti TaxID=1233113 RepID=UPI003A8B9D68
MAPPLAAADILSIRPDRLVLATSAVLAPVLAPLLPAAEIATSPSGVDHLLTADKTVSVRLVCIGFGHVLSLSTLGRCGAGAINLHPAPPDYPGSAVNHLALYEGATRFGVTAHLMEPAVDSGPILAVDRFDIPPGIGHRGLDELTWPALLRLLHRLSPCLRGLAPWPDRPSGEHWRGPASRRARVMDLTRIGQDLTPAEAARRHRAFRDGPDSALLFERNGTWQPYQPSGRIKGWVDGIIGDTVRGWAYDPTEPAHRTRIRVEADGYPVADLIADGQRRDVADAGHGDGNCGFILPLAQLSATARQLEILLPDDEWRRLPGGPLLLPNTG